MDTTIQHNIRVSIPSVDYDAVCSYYNTHKPESWVPIKRLHVYEGGFGIDIPDHKPHADDFFSHDINARTKQVRWTRRWLLSHMGCPQLSSAETQLLYEALVSVYGTDKIFLEQFTML